MPDEDSLPTKARHIPWNKGKLIGAKPPLRPNQVCSIRTRLLIGRPTRDLAPFNLAIDSKLRGCDVVTLKIEDVAPNGYAVDRATVRQKKTGRPVKFELTDQTRQAVDDFLKEVGKRPGEYLFTGRRGRDRAMTTRQYARLLTDRVASIGLDPRVFGTHSLRWTKATLIYRHTGNLRAGSSCSATPRSKARCVISASRLTTRSRLPSKLMSESPGQGRHAVRFFANNGLTTTCNYVDLGVVNDVRCGHERRFRPVRRMSASPLPAPD